MSSSAERFHFDDRFGHITTSMANSVIDAAYAAGQEAKAREMEEAMTDICKSCGGKGYIEQMESDPGDGGRWHTTGESDPCPTCQGTGKPDPTTSGEGEG